MMERTMHRPDRSSTAGMMAGTKRNADMHGPLNITAARLASEAAGFQQKLGVGLQTLCEVEQFDYGATEKQEVWRDGKTVLYRFVSHGRPTAKAPLPICYALVNHPYRATCGATSRSCATLSTGVIPIARIAYCAHCLPRSAIPNAPDGPGSGLPAATRPSPGSLRPHARSSRW